MATEVNKPENLKLEEMNHVSIQSLPDEILLTIFRYLPADEFIAVVTRVCKQWLNIITSDSHTLKRIVMYDHNLYKQVCFYYLKSDSEDQIFDSAREISENMTEDFIVNNCSVYILDKIPYDAAFYLCAQYPKVFGQIKTFAIVNCMEMYLTTIFINLNSVFNNLTTLVFNKVRINHIIKEFGIVCPNIQNVSYLDVEFRQDFDKKFLYAGFKQLKRFCLDHYSISSSLLEDILKIHRIEAIVFINCFFLNDPWLDVLMKQLKGRTVKYLHLNSKYFTKKCLNTFLESNLVLDKSKVDLNLEYNEEIVFSIKII